MVLHFERATGVGDQSKGRRSDVHAERGIRLADGQVWTFLSPGGHGTCSADVEFGPDYLELIRAILEAEDRNEGRMAELALAMLLIGHKHPLTPNEYQRLFMFEPDSPELAASQAAFHDLALDHVDHVTAMGGLSRTAGERSDAPGALGRFLSRLRNQWRLRAWPHATRKREAVS